MLLALVGDSAVLGTPPSRNSVVLATPLSRLSSKVGKLHSACDAAKSNLFEEKRFSALFCENFHLMYYAMIQILNSAVLVTSLSQNSAVLATLLSHLYSKVGKLIGACDTADSKLCDACDTAELKLRGACDTAGRFKVSFNQKAFNTGLKLL